MSDLVYIWAGLVGLAMILYVIMDGTNLGVGLLFLTTRDEKERDVLIDTISPVWDANQTWLVLGGGAIFAVFPVVYAVLSSALYIPLMTFIFGLIFRGVTFEFRLNASRRERWSLAFSLGSLIAVLSQGFTLGGVLSSIKVSGTTFAGGPFDWLNPFSIMVGCALVPGYVMLASTFLIIKTAGPIQERAYRLALGSTLIVLFFMAVVTVWTPFHYPVVWKFWFSPPRIYFIWAFPLLGLIAAAQLLRSVRNRHRESSPHLYAIFLFLSGYIGLAASLFPYAIPPRITLEEAAAQYETLRFMLWATAIILPAILAYVIYSYSVFRGKVHPGEYY